MLLFFFSVVAALATAAVSTSIWLGFRLAGRRLSGRAVLRRSLIAYGVTLPAFTFILAPMILAGLMAKATTRPQDRQLQETPAAFGREFREVVFPSRDGLELQGWLLPGDPTRPVFIVTHGLFRSRAEVLERACRLNRHGYPVLLFDFRSHGASGHRPVTLGYQERLDVLGGWDYIKKEGLAGPVVLLGVSMGAVAAALAAPELGAELEALIADSPFQNLNQTVSHHLRLWLGLPAFPFANLFVWNLSRLGGFDALELDAGLSFHKLQETPVLLIYGAEDERIPAQTALNLHDSIPGRNKEITFFPRAGHGAAFPSDPKRYIDTILTFLDQGRAPLG